MQLYALYKYVDDSIPAFQEPDYKRKLVGLFFNLKDAENAAKEHGIDPDVDLVETEKYLGN